MISTLHNISRKYIFSCEDAALQVLMSVCLCVDSSHFTSMYSIVQVCTALYKSVQHCTSLYNIDKHVQNCTSLYKHAVTKECMQLHKPACSYISLHAVT